MAASSRPSCCVNVLGIHSSLLKRRDNATASLLTEIIVERHAKARTFRVNNVHARVMALRFEKSRSGIGVGRSEIALEPRWRLSYAHNCSVDAVASRLRSHTELSES